MNEQGQAIQDAIKETGKVECLSDVEGYKGLEEFGRYAALCEGILYWYNKSDEKEKPVRLDFIHANDWQPYPNKKDIRPERAGELWEYRNPNRKSLWFIHRDTSGIRWTCEDGDSEPEEDMADIIHNQNSWKLIYSPDEEVMKELEGEKG